MNDTAHNLELLLWKAAASIRDIGAFCDDVAGSLLQELPITAFAIRRVDPNAQLAWTIGYGPRTEPRLASRTTIPDAQLHPLRTWLQRPRADAAIEPLDDALRASLAPGGLGGRFLATTIPDVEGPPAVFVVRLASGHRSLHAVAATLPVLLEPVAAAIANAGCRDELQRLREARDADATAGRHRVEPRDIAEAIVGAEHGLRDVMRRVEQVAPTEAPVLVLGETGSGKEVIARSIHQGSRRRDGPMLRVNCGAIPTELVDAELFGHERGSFTGAVSTRKGWFERAAGGTLFLDEVGELPAAAQVRLLRVLQDGTFERVGGQRPLLADVRIVAATHRDLRGMVALGRFREDLWYRLSVFPIELPPLRDRAADIRPLAESFADRAGRRLTGFPLRLDADDIALLEAYPWPGNVRELAAVIDRAAILGDGRRLDVRAALGTAGAPATVRTAIDALPDAPDIPNDARRTVPIAPAHPAAPARERPQPRRDDETIDRLDDAMATHIRAALTRCLGRIEGPFGAAALLEVNPHTLRSRMRRLGIDWSQFRPRPQTEKTWAPRTRTSTPSPDPNPDRDQRDDSTSA